MMDGIVIVGASAAGLAAAETLRQQGFAGTMTLIGDEDCPPYDRPPLSKQVLRGSWVPEKTQLRDRGTLDKLGATWRLGVAACGLDLGSRALDLSDGTRIGFDGLVIATGVSPRRLPYGHDLSGVHVLRTLGDALAIRSRLVTQPRVVVVGAGFLGAEAAAVACELGLEVTMVDVFAAPLVRQLGPEMGARLADLHRSRGVQLRMSAGVTGFEAAGGQVRGVRLDDGSVIPAELVIVSIGAVPNTSWLTGSGLALTDGVGCDPVGRAALGVVAAGDVANWLEPRSGIGRRMEHRLNATEQGTAAACTLLGISSASPHVPYFWTDQFDARIQVYGRPDPAADVSVVAGDPATDRFAVAYRAGGRTVAGLSWNMPREARRLRQEVLDDLPNLALRHIK